MRDEIFSIMSKVNKTGHYSKYDTRSRAGSFRGTFDHDFDQSIQQDVASNGGRVKQQFLGDPIHEKSPSFERLGDRNKDTIKREDRE